MSAKSLKEVLRQPIVVAPMGGGPSTPALVTAAASAGALGFLAAGYKTADAVMAEIEAVRASTTEAFGVNVFLPGTPTTQPAETIEYVGSLGDDAERLGAALGRPEWDDDDWVAKVDVLLANPPPVISFTFGCPPPEIVAAFREAGSVVAVTITDPREALLAVAAGADCLCVQGIEAGAHRGVFTNDSHSFQGRELLPLITEVARVADLPQIAAGGIMTRAAVEAVLRAGAVAAQSGTAFLRCPESGAHPAHKGALGDDRFTSTALTRSFSGRPARGLVNRFMVDHPDTPAAYPEINNATRPLRTAAALAGDVDRMSLWAGTGFKEATCRPAGEIIDLLGPNKRAPQSQGNSLMIRSPGDPAMTHPDGVVVAGEILQVLGGLQDDDPKWSAIATPTTWSAARSLEHIVDSLLFYAGQVARRAESRLPVLRDGRAAPPREQLDTVLTAAHLLAGQLRDLGAGRAWHPSGFADSSGWAGMAVTEILVHGMDVARATQVDLLLPVAVCRRTRRSGLPMDRPHFGARRRAATRGNRSGLLPGLDVRSRLVVAVGTTHRMGWESASA